MPPSDQYEEDKVQKCLALLRENPSMPVAQAARQTRALYGRVVRRLQGIPRSSSRGGHNKRLNIPEDNILKEYLLMYYSIGRGAGVDNIIAAANSIIRY